jgi:hypothetical protein
MAASIVGMAPKPTQIASATPGHGFVIAMRARLTTAKGLPRLEWIIVSRWGVAGENLSIARTRVPVLLGKAAPIHLAPRQTALAELLRLPPAAGPATFLFARELAGAVTLAGHFAPAEGYVRLLSGGAALRLRAEGRCAVGVNRACWRVEAARAAWIGEFIEGVA